MELKLCITFAPSEADHQAILAPLLAYNDKMAGPSGYEPFAILLRDTQGNACGGLWGKISYDWLFVELLFVPEEMRGTGLGSQLLRTAEQLAGSRQCVGVWLDTHGFQAPAFYLKQGYEAFGALEDHPRGSQRVFYRKTIR